MAQTVTTVQLKSETLHLFEAYIREAEEAMEQTLHGNGAFLWSDARPDRALRIRDGAILAQFWSGRGPLRVTDGLIHDWIGAEFIPDVSVELVVRLVQDYENHKNIYKPEVIDSRLLSHHGNDFQIYLRLLKKKIITVVLDTYHDVHYSSLDRARWLCRSYTTRILEVEGAGSSQETILPPDTGLRIPLASVFLLEISGETGRRVRRVSRHFPVAQRAPGIGMADRTDHPETTQGVAGQYPRCNPAGARRHVRIGAGCRSVFRPL